jgi:tektin-1
MFTRSITREEWEHFSKKFIERAAKDVNNARPLCSYIDILLKQVTEDLLNQYRVTNESFTRRIQETRNAKIKLENEHHEVIHNIHSEGKNNKYVPHYNE